MQLIGSWTSGFTRRVGITLKFLDLPFEHLDFNVFLRPEDVRPYSPMLKVPVLVLDDGEMLLDSSGIIDYLHEQVGPIRALIAIGGPERRAALRIVGLGMAVYEKLNSIYAETLRPADRQLDSALDYFTAQAMTGLEMLEAEAGEGWMVGGALSQADIMTVVAYQGASRMTLPTLVHAGRFPKLAALSGLAMNLSAFSSTLPKLP
ncbi:MAG: glutathione S-transferase family protein [Pseudomonas sp.]|nr:glutathione S-transferase family protein [Pseudomonas sp.]